MSDAKHTKGPWVREDVNSDHLHDICVGYDIPGAGSPVLLATVFFDDDLPGISLEEATANARLIAAAPDLLAAAELVLARVRGAKDGSFRLYVSDVTDLRAAVVKARGT